MSNEERDPKEERDAPQAAPTEADVRAAQGAEEAEGPSEAVLTVQSSTVYAVVRADGTLARGFGGPASFLQSTGSYVIYFGLNISRGAFSATIANPDTDTGFTPPGFIIANRIDGTNNGVRIVTRDMTGTRADRPFHLAVHFLDL